MDDHDPSSTFRIGLQTHPDCAQLFQGRACTCCSEQIIHESDDWQHVNVCHGTTPDTEGLDWVNYGLVGAKLSDGKFLTSNGANGSLGKPGGHVSYKSIPQSRSYTRLCGGQTTFGGRTQSELTAAQIGQLSLGRNAQTPTPPPTKKRPATSEIPQPENLIMSSNFGANLAPQSGLNCTKRLAIGAKTPFPLSFQENSAFSNDLRKKSSFTQCGAHATYQRQATTPGSRDRPIESPSYPTIRVTAHQHQAASCQGSDVRSTDHRYPGIVLQPASRPITSDQLAGEMKNIYSDLVAVEAKCISLDTAELASDSREIKVQEREKWQAMMALHRTLLYGHHDFLSASQHPAASEPLQRLALKYSMPARMWKNAIHSFLEVLRRRLPDSMDYMLQFIYTAYQMIALLYETIEAFKPTWIECLGDLARYRMAIEDGVQRDRETWGVVAKSWYSAASDINPDTGRLYHHLGILARPNAVRQLYYYCRSLTCIQPFPNARESLSTLLVSAVKAQSSGRPLPHVHELDGPFVYLHAIMFMDLASDGGSHTMQTDFSEVQTRYISKLPEQISSLGEQWKEHGVSVAIANIAACFDYGYQGSGNPLALAFANDMDGAAGLLLESGHGKALKRLIRPATLLFLVFATVLSREADSSALPHVHILLVLIKSLALLSIKAGSSISAFLRLVPWWQLMEFLNSFTRTEPVSTKLLDGSPPKSFQSGFASPLPEDYSLRGEVWAGQYFPEGWFKDAPDEDTRYLEQASTDRTRVQRVYWLGISICKHVEYLSFDANNMRFGAPDELRPFPARIPKVSGMNSHAKAFW